MMIVAGTLIRELSCMISTSTKALPTLQACGYQVVFGKASGVESGRLRVFCVSDYDILSISFYILCVVVSQMGALVKLECEWMLAAHHDSALLYSEVSGWRFDA